MRYWKLDMELLSQEWFAVLSPGSQMAWIQINVHCKAVGTNGRCKRLSHMIAARSWGLGTEDIEKAERAAAAAGHLAIEGDDWVCLKWADEQGDPTVAARVRKHREGKKPAPVTDVTRYNRNKLKSPSTDVPTEPAPAHAVTDVTRYHTDNENENESPPVSVSRETKTAPQGAILAASSSKTPSGPTRAEVDQAWERFQDLYPKRLGDLGKAKGQEKLTRLLKAGEDFERILAGCQRYRNWADATQKTRTEFIKQIPTWLNGRAWEEEWEIPDDAPGKSDGPPLSRMEAARRRMLGLDRSVVAEEFSASVD